MMSCGIRLEDELGGVETAKEGLCATLNNGCMRGDVAQGGMTARGIQSRVRGLGERTHTES